MNTTKEFEKQEKRFNICKFLVQNYLQKRLFVTQDQNAKALAEEPDLQDAKVFLRFFQKDVSMFNAKINAQVWEIEWLDYSDGYLDLEVFKNAKIPLNEIDALMEEHPQKRAIDIYKMLISPQS